MFDSIPDWAPAAVLAAMLAAYGTGLLLAGNQSVSVSYDSGFTIIGQDDFLGFPIPAWIALAFVSVTISECIISGATSRASATMSGSKEMKPTGSSSALNAKKRLFELGGALHGEALFEFEHYNDVGLYRELIRSGISEYVVAPISMADVVSVISTRL